MSSIVHLLALSAAAGAVALGCDAVGPAEPPVPARDDSPLQTASLEYPFAYNGGTYHGTIVATFTNTGSATVYPAMCGFGGAPVFFLTWAPGMAPADLEGPVSTCVGTPPVAMQPAASRTDTLDFLLHERAPNGQYTAAPRNAGRLGLYRVFYHVYSRVEGRGDDATGAGLLSQAAGLSNVFGIRFTR